MPIRIDETYTLYLEAVAYVKSVAQRELGQLQFLTRYMNNFVELEACKLQTLSKAHYELAYLARLYGEVDVARIHQHEASAMHELALGDVLFLLYPPDGQVLAALKERLSHEQA